MYAMKKLILIRHGKSSWDLPFKDSDRPLSKRGLNDAHLISEKITKDLPTRFMVWSSPAKRARNTAIIFTQHQNIPSELLIVNDDLYTFDVKKLAAAIKKCKNEHPNLILFGHNNAITDFVNKFGDKSIRNVPTAGVVIMQFDEENWQDISKGKIIKTIFPKEFKT